MSEKTVTEEDIREEHLQSVSEGRHWAYLLGVLGGSVGLMIAFIAWLGAGS